MKIAKMDMAKIKWSNSSHLHADSKGVFSVLRLTHCGSQKGLSSVKRLCVVKRHHWRYPIGVDGAYETWEVAAAMGRP